MKPLRTSAVLLAATAAAVAAMLATSAVDGETDSTQSSETVGPAAGTPDSGGFQAPMSQDYRAGLFALQTGRLTFGQLWFAAGR